MAPPPAKFSSFLFLASLLLLSQQAQARESQFFSKATHVQETPELPKTQTPETKQEQEQEKEQEPSFMPETRGYGLYGHESGQLPPTTTSNSGAPYTTTAVNDAPYTTTSAMGVQYNPNNNLPYTTEATVKEQQHTDKYPETYHTQYNPNNNLPYTTEATVKEQQHTSKYPETYHTQYNPNRNNFYYNGNNFEANPSGLSETRLTQTQGSSYTTPTHYQNSNSYYNSEKQGMSDTRFLENGKYYYDPRSENNYNQNQYGNSRVVDSRNWYNNRGNYGNGNGNQNTYNSVEGYQNEEQFQESEDEFIP